MVFAISSISALSPVRNETSETFIALKQCNKVSFFSENNKTFIAHQQKTAEIKANA